MADTIITNTPPSEGGGGGAGWVVAIVIIAAVAVGGYFLYQSGAFRGAPAGDSTNINITNPLPEAPAAEAPIAPPAE